VLVLNSSYGSWHDAAQTFMTFTEQAQIFGETAVQFYRIK
jgi:predicted TIM-barrel fold metal-dependent hydrolase